MTKMHWLVLAIIAVIIALGVVVVFSQSYLLKTKAEEGIGTSTKAQIFVPK